MESQGGDSQIRRKACEECRRLKLKCDRSLKTNSLKLHETITEMSSRILQLEEALASLQAQVSTDVHPLLTDDSVKIPLAPKPHAPEKVATEEETDIIDTLGAFSIGEKGEVIFHEATATSEYLLEVVWTGRHSFITENQRNLSLPPDLILLSALFPFPPETVTTHIDDLIHLMPDFDTALNLVNIYFPYSSWCQEPIPREEFMRRIFNECYPNGAIPTTLQHLSSHKLSVLFMVFALGALMDVNRPLCSVEAEEYHILARACLCIEPVYETSSLHSVQAMHLMIWYYTLAATRRTNGYRLAIWGVVIRLSQAIGLHHDTSKLKLEASDAKLREVVHWEVICMDFWQSFVIGRPSSMSFSTSQCKRPYDLKAIPENPVEAQAVAWFAWKHDYTHLLHGVVEQAFRSKGTTYSQILTLDQKLRNHPAPSILWWPPSQEALLEKLRHSPPLAMQCYMRLNLQESSLLHLHRRFFMQAIRANPTDPFQHHFGPSVRFVFSSACAMICGLWAIYHSHALVVRRFPIAWSHGFSAAIVLSSLVISAPTCVLAPPALKELDRACALFRENEHISLQPPNSRSILEDMQRKAYIAMNLHMPISDATTEKLGGVYPNKTVSKTGTGNSESTTSLDQMLLQVDSEHWRMYATLSSTPTGDHDLSEQDDAIQVDIAPEEPSTELSNWESFIHGLRR
ncbi:hypothetical protein Clacol_005428 [Clathrus columnatus]|uniref:Xylanolytic transcriptional activator regulatory domain-containing protein n=1 Tax=Clathrus columnatus TaxID=1419009 RepID=A0AAV5AFD6_9AGAM|nr:hypothetical protein Clacol_005428 [Clathrus columnatus]